MVHFDDANGLVRVGTGNIVGFHTFLTWQDPDVVLAFKCAAVSTGWGADGDWVVCTPEQCSGVFDAVEAGRRRAPRLQLARLQPGRLPP